MREPSGWDRTESESLLDSTAPDTPLGRLLAAARGPAGPHELTGEHAAVAMLRSAIATGPPIRRRRTRSRALVVWSGLAGMLLAGSGLAVAGATGALPIPPAGDRPAVPAVPPETSRPVPAGREPDRPGPTGPVSPTQSTRPDPVRATREPTAPPIPIAPATTRPGRPADPGSAGTDPSDQPRGGGPSERPGRTPPRP